MISLLKAQTAASRRRTRLTRLSSRRKTILIQPHGNRLSPLNIKREPTPIPFRMCLPRSRRSAPLSKQEGPESRAQSTIQMDNASPGTLISYSSGGSFFFVALAYRQKQKISASIVDGRRLPQTLDGNSAGRRRPSKTPRNCSCSRAKIKPPPRGKRNELKARPPTNSTDTYIQNYAIHSPLRARSSPTPIRAIPKNATLKTPRPRAQSQKRPLF